MADETNNKKINPSGIVSRTPQDDSTEGDATQSQDDFGQIDPAPRPEPRPPDDESHNADGHHHHEHQHDDDTLLSDEDIGDSNDEITGTPDEDVVEDDFEVIITEEEGNPLTDNSTEDEEISDNFGVDGVTIEQTLYRRFDPFSGLDVFQNAFNDGIFTDEKLSEFNSDKRISLGMFSFDDENVLSDNIQDIIRGNKFKQTSKPNLVPNGSGRAVKSIFENKSGNGQRERFFIPEGGWGYCTYDAVGPDFRKRRSDLYGPVSEDSEFQGYGNFIEDRTNGKEFIQSFTNSVDSNYPYEEGLDNHDVQGYAGFYPYFFDYRTGRDAMNSLIALQLNLVSGSIFAENTNQGIYNTCNKLFMFNQRDSFAKASGSASVDHASVSTRESRLTCYKCRAIGRQDPSDYDAEQSISDIYFPNFARWVITDEAFSYSRCLEFLATNYVNGMCDFNDNGTIDTNSENDFSWTSGYNMNTTNGGVLNNQYRSLNQVVKIFDRNDEVINPFTIMEVKFKMKTLDFFYDENNPPQVELSIVDGDGNMGSPLRIEDRITDRELGYYPNQVYWPHGDFNSQRYSDDLNSVGTLDRKYSNFGSMGRFENTVVDKWETFSYKFSLADIFRYSQGHLRDLYLIVQAADEFIGRVLLDDFEIYESADFIPEVDVRKKISVGNYGKADLTKYYDKELQPIEYKDSQAPLEAQFYFYPMYPSDDIFEVKRTPVYQDFKNGMFYLYDVDWGDGSKNEFTSEPKQIDEETAVYHTYESNGVFEITGTMLRMKTNNVGEEIGIIKNKNFKLRININEGTAEDFKYFGSDGFSFIPYKNTLPIIGGYSKQSIYYKSLKRFNGFIDDEQTNIGFKYQGDKLKTQIAFDKMDSSFSSNFNLLNEYKKPRLDFIYDDNNNIIDFVDIYNGIQTNSEELGKNIGDCDLTNIKYYNTPKSIWELFGFEKILDEQDTEEIIGEDFTPGLFQDFFDPNNFTTTFDTAREMMVQLSQDGTATWYEQFGLWFGSAADNDLAPYQHNPDTYLQDLEERYYRVRLRNTSTNNELQFSHPILETLYWFEVEDEIYSEMKSGNVINILPQQSIEIIIPFTTAPIDDGISESTDSPFGVPNNPRYWKNIIPADYSIFSREGLGGEIVDIYSEQEWLDDYYYPVLPKYNQNGRFSEDDFPNNKIPFPMQGQITDENETNENLVINITREQIESNTFNDNSGNQNLGFGIMDYKPEFNNTTLKPKKKRSIDLIKSSTNNGAF